MDAKKIGQRLRMIRETRGQTKRFVARATGLSYSAICSYEYGLRIPSDEAKIKLSAHFGCTLEELFFADINH